MRRTRTVTPVLVIKAITVLSIAAITAFTVNAGAQVRTSTVPPQMEFVQQLDAQLPMNAEFADDNGEQVQLADLFGKWPVVLVPGYFHCPNLCSTLMEGVLQSFADVRFRNLRYRLVVVSIDPRENAELAARKKASYAPSLQTQAGGILHLLTGKEREIARFAKAAGFQYAYDPVLQQYAHPAGFLIATPDGRISRYFMGVRFDPEEVRTALRNAEAGRIGTPIDRLLLLCAHFDPRSGRYSMTVMAAVRAICVAMLAALVFWIWRHRTRREHEK